MKIGSRFYENSCWVLTGKDFQRVIKPRIKRIFTQKKLFGALKLLKLAFRGSFLPGFR
jgi:hypothetical protein